MNLILLEPAEALEPHVLLTGEDPRLAHVREILRADAGDVLRVGVIDGKRGTAHIVRLSDDALELKFNNDWQDAPPPHPLTLLVGLPRPPTARKILTQCTAQGVQRIWFFNAELGEKSYAHSPLWHTDEWRERLVEGASQAVATRLPEVRRFKWLREAVEALQEELPGASRIALDAERGATHLGGFKPEAGAHTVLALGAERGWTDKERDRMQGSGYAFHHLGERVLRVETAAVAATAIILGLSG